MARIRIKNFGPIKEGYTQDDGFIDITPVTVICGDQATGKSTIAEVYSTFAWLEKDSIDTAMKRNKSPEFDDFKQLFENQRIEEYFLPGTEIEYQGTIGSFSYKDGKSKSTFDNNLAERLIEYKRPKIMYVPSERNLLTVIEDAENVKKLPRMLSLLLDEYNKAKKTSSSGIFDLPISNLKLRYNKTTTTTDIIAPDNTSVSIYSSSSGVQSVVPLSLVTRYLTNEITADFAKNVQNLSSNEREQMKAWIQEYSGNDESEKKIIESLDSLFYGRKIDNTMYSILERSLPFFFNTCFINIVEEPEQNLYPVSQSRVLYELLECMNTNDHNGLMITTHSPYMLSYLTLSAKAAELRAKKVPDVEINKIFPVKSAVSGSKITIYETKEDGTIQKLEPYESLPSDNNELNAALNETNETFAGLLELEEKFC
jgi:predicted ATPase